MDSFLVPVNLKAEYQYELEVNAYTPEEAIDKAEALIVLLPGMDKLDPKALIDTKGTATEAILTKGKEDDDGR